MWVIPTVPGVPSVEATCEAGPAEEERLKKLREEAEARARASTLVAEPAPTPPKAAG